jgi:hypothetical protein
MIYVKLNNVSHSILRALRKIKSLVAYYASSIPDTILSSHPTYVSVRIKLFLILCKYIIIYRTGPVSARILKEDLANILVKYDTPG